MHGSRPKLAQPALVHKINKDDGLRTKNHKTRSESLSFTGGPDCNSQHLEKSGNYDLPCVREEYLKQGFSDDAIDILMKSWRSGTVKQYQPVIKNWIKFCGNDIDPFQPPITKCLDFLSSLFKNGSSYNQIANARSALSSIVSPMHEITFGRLPVVKSTLDQIRNDI